MNAREAMGTRAIRRALAELNANSDGPCEVAVYWLDHGAGERSADLRYAGDDPEGAVVTVPGDDKPFPLVSFVEALACSEVRDR